MTWTTCVYVKRSCHTHTHTLVLAKKNENEQFNLVLTRQHVVCVCVCWWSNVFKFRSNEIKCKKKEIHHQHHWSLALYIWWSMVDWKWTFVWLKFDLTGQPFNRKFIWVFFSFHFHFIFFHLIHHSGHTDLIFWITDCQSSSSSSSHIDITLDHKKNVKFSYK